MGTPWYRRQLTWDETLFSCFLVLYSIYAEMFIFVNSSVIEGQRYFHLFDDAWINMRYARNFAEGFGFVWNPGFERVEGFTPFLWTCFMIIPHALGIPDDKTGLFMTQTGLVILFLSLFFLRKLIQALFPGNLFILYGALTLTAFYYPINYWGLLPARERGDHACGDRVFVAAVTRPESKAAWVWIYTLQTVCFWLRMDGAVPFVVFWVYGCLLSRRDRSWHLKMGLVFLGFSVMALTWFPVFGIFTSGYRIPITRK